MRGRAILLIGVAAAALGSGAAPALADHHLVKIREFFPGTAAVANDAFLELQMYSPGQQFVGGHDVQIYGPGADDFPSTFVPSPFLPPPANGQAQRSVLLAGSGGPVGRDYTENLDGAGSKLDPTGGAICFVSVEGFGTIDCVEWGTGNASVDAGTPVLPSGIPDGSSIERSIERGCSTLLQATDDTDDSAADFDRLATPTPRANATAPTEHACPNTTLTKTPKKRTTKRRAKFAFTATGGVDEFECKLDKAPFKACESPFRKRVKRGKHSFKVKAEGDDSPASFRWKVVKKN
jgi:hypothetical protein